MTAIEKVLYTGKTHTTGGRKATRAAPTIDWRLNSRRRVGLEPGRIRAAFRGRMVGLLHRRNGAPLHAK